MFSKTTDQTLTLRPIIEGDEKLLYEIYASTREKEMERVPHWTIEQKNAFLWQQFTAQHTWYRQHYGDAYFCIIQKGRVPIGRLYVSPSHTDGSVRIIDITLLPAFRNKGYGEQLLKDVMAFAKKEGRSLTIHVESFNPAMKLYERLGFLLKDRKNEVYHLLEWQSSEPMLQTA